MNNELVHDTKPARAAVTAVRACADTMQSQAENLMHALADVPMDATLRTQALELGAALKDTSNRVMFELALLQIELGEGKADAASTLQRVSSLDAALMAVVAGATDLLDQLERAAERDEQQEPAFVLVIDAVGIMLQGLERAKTASGALAPESSSGPAERG